MGALLRERNTFGPRAPEDETGHAGDIAMERK